MIPALCVLSMILANSRVQGLVQQEREVILLPTWDAKKDAEIPLRFKAFGYSVELDLRRNEKMIATQFQVWKHKNDGSAEELSHLNEPYPCHYIHVNDLSSAAVSLCEERGLHGIVFMKNVTLEIAPVQREDVQRYSNKRPDMFFEKLHVVKRTIHNGSAIDDSLKDVENILRPRNTPRRSTKEKLTLELAVFFDEAGYNIFSPYLSGSDEKIRDMLLAYINGVQAIYHHPSLGRAVDISLVRLEIMQKQPADLPHYNGERSSLLDSFCKYAESRNPPGDEHPRHWDMGLLVSGLDFYTIEDGRKSSGTMGLATVGTVCIDKYACVITELGVTNHFGRPYPSAGFTSVYIAAHEIGHNLGMYHDSSHNSCPRDGYIMSPSRGVDGETMWSSCSREVAERLALEKPCLLDEPAKPTEDADRLDHGRYLGLPGREWDAKRQCQLLLLDGDATVVSLSEICKALHCRTPHRSGYYVAGPALDGTRCAPGMECRGGECLPVVGPPYGELFVQEGGWSEWKSESCSSGCLERSKGALARRRSCDQPPPKNTDRGCEGFHFDVVLCEDEELCRGSKRRKTAVEYASSKCAEFSASLPELDEKGSGLQAFHESARPWMACAIFCRRRNTGGYYTPRIELNDLGLDPYFPDGTWCHAENGQNYFCRQHHCLPEDFRFELRSKIPRDEDLLDNGPQNASPHDREIPPELIKYLSLGPDGLPLLTSLPHNLTLRPDHDRDDDDEWVDKDYIELPTLG